MNRTQPIGFLLVVAVLAPLAAQVSNAEAQPTVRMCLDRIGGGSEKEFLAFDRELRAAMSAEDPTFVALLASYPLRMNDGNGRILIDDAPTLAARAATLLPPAVRSAVLGTSVENVICSTSAIGYGRGAVWVRVDRQFGVDRFVIGTINLPDRPAPPGPGVVFVCRAEQHRIVVDRLADDRLRYRSWNRPRALTDKPDLELTGGEAEHSGSGVCVHWSWSFTNAKTEYYIAEAACTAEEPPKGAIGEMSVTVGSKTLARSWCY